MDFKFLTNCLKAYRFLDGKGSVNSVSIMQIVRKQKLEGSVPIFNRGVQQNYTVPLIQQSATVSPHTFARDMVAALQLQLNQPVAPQLAQSLASQSTPSVSVHGSSQI